VIYPVLCSCFILHCLYSQFLLYVLIFNMGLTVGSISSLWYEILSFFAAMKIQVVAFRVVTPCSVVGYQPFGGPSPRSWKQHGLPKRWYPTATLRGVRTQKTPTGTSCMVILLYLSFVLITQDSLPYRRVAFSEPCCTACVETRRVN
jgi:hypothetical protein